LLAFGNMQFLALATVLLALFVFLGTAMILGCTAQVFLCPGTRSARFQHAVAFGTSTVQRVFPSTFPGLLLRLGFGRAARLFLAPGLFRFVLAALRFGGFRLTLLACQPFGFFPFAALLRSGQLTFAGRLIGGLVSGLLTPVYISTPFAHFDIDRTSR